MRDAPSLALIPALLAAGASVRAYDPESMGQARLALPQIDYAEEPYQCARDADALVIVTEWEQFRALDLLRIKAAMRTPVVVDLRNIYRPDDMTRHGFSYTSIGRGT